MMTTYPDRSSSGKGILAHNSRVPSITVLISRQELEAVSPITHSQKQRESNACRLKAQVFLSAHTTEGPKPEKQSYMLSGSPYSNLHNQSCPPQSCPLANPTQTVPHWGSSQTILGCIKLTIKTNQHSQCMFS